MDTLDKLIVIVALWNAADLAATVAYYGGPPFTEATREEHKRILHAHTYTDSARRNILRLYALAVADQRRGEDLTLRRIFEWKRERHEIVATAAWIGRYLDDTAERLTGAKLLRAPLPTCDDIVTTLPTGPQTIGDVTAWFTADGATKTTEKKTEET